MPTSGESQTYGGAERGVRNLLRAEGAVLFIVCTGLYFTVANAPWWLFAVLFLAPDLAFIAFAAGKRIGALAYNAAHTTIGPLALLLIGFLAANDTLIAISLIWGAHIGIDRAVGYGLRYPSSYEHTHLGAVGALRKAGG